MNAGERPAEDRRNALYMRAQQNSAAARLTMHFRVAAGLTAKAFLCSFRSKMAAAQSCHVMGATVAMERSIEFGL